MGHEANVTSGTMCLFVYSVAKLLTLHVWSFWREKQIGIRVLQKNISLVQRELIDKNKPCKIWMDSVRIIAKLNLIESSIDLVKKY